MTFDLTRPLHVFDAKKLSGDLVMRQARDGEKILALDGKTYELDPSISVIADAKAARDAVKVHALADEMTKREQQVEAALAHAVTFDASLVTKLGEMRFYRRFVDEASSILEQLE